MHDAAENQSSGRRSLRKLESMRHMESMDHMKPSGALSPNLASSLSTEEMEYQSTDGLKHVYYADGSFSLLRLTSDCAASACTSAICKNRRLPVEAHILSVRDR